MNVNAIRANGSYIEEYLASSIEDQTLRNEIHQVVVDAWRIDVPSVADWLEQQKRAEDLSRDVYVFAAFLEQRVIGTGRLTIHSSVSDLPEAYLFEGLEEDLPAPIASLNRLAVLGSYRGKGIATAIDAVRIEKARSLGARSVAGICRESRAHSLIRHGFQMLRAPKPGKAVEEISWAVVGKKII